MDAIRFLIFDTAARIIVNSGLEALTIPNLEKEMGLDRNQLNNQFTKDDDILLLLLVNFETELNGVLQEITNKGVLPEAKLQLLFKNLYSLFMFKPYYLSVIFDKNLTGRDHTIKMSIQRIRHVAETNLSEIIDAGKKGQTFKTRVSTKLLVKKILTGFRMLMKDEQLVQEMILELKNLKKQSNDEGN